MTNELLAGQVMDAAAALLNDQAKQINTYVVQIPYLNLALQELQEFFELNNIPVTDHYSAIMVVPAGVTSIGFALTGLSLPHDLIEPSKLWESTTNSYSPISRVDYLPKYETAVNGIGGYVWQGQEIRFLASNSITNIKMDYIRNLFSRVINDESIINIINAETFLAYRTASLCAEFIGENKTRADELNGFASLAIDRTIGIGTKGRQIMVTRRQPFRSNYKRGGSF